jgi:hypothetical protein
MAFVRIWRTRVDLERLDEYLRFIDEQSLPMFNGQQWPPLRGATRTPRRRANASVWVTSSGFAQRTIAWGRM